MTPGRHWEIANFALCIGIAIAIFLGYLTVVGFQKDIPSNPYQSESSKNIYILGYLNGMKKAIKYHNDYDSFMGLDPLNMADDSYKKDYQANIRNEKP